MVNHKLCFVCKYRGRINGLMISKSNVYCAYLPDTGKLPEGYINADGEWRRKAQGMSCPEFCAGQPPRRNQTMQLPEAGIYKFKNPEDW